MIPGEILPGDGPVVINAGRIEHSGDVATADAAMFANLVAI